jgi:hypothetical protein
MADPKELTGSQVLGGAVGAVVGNIKGTSLGGALAMAALPVLGPFALLLVPAVAIAGTVAGARVGSKGLARAAMLAVCATGTDVIPDSGSPPTHT